MEVGETKEQASRAQASGGSFSEFFTVDCGIVIFELRIILDIDSLSRAKGRARRRLYFANDSQYRFAARSAT
jgi:hypothetical protein